MQTSSRTRTWNIAAGTYDIGRNATVNAGGQTGWYFPITASGITITGAGIDSTVITSTVFSTNGSWASQDMIAVFGDNVTIQDLTVRAKMDTNKAIEVIGKNVTLKNIAVRNNTLLTHASYLSQKGVAADSDTDYWEGYATMFAGSIYFNPTNTDKDIGNAVLDNVYITQAWISCRTDTVLKGKLTLKGGTTIDFRGSWYADSSGVISKNPAIIVAEDFKVLVDDTLGDLQTQVLDRVPLGTDVIGQNATEVTAGVDPTYTIVIPAAVNLGSLQKNTGLKSQAFDVTAQNVVIEESKHIIVSVSSNFKLTSGTTLLGYLLYKNTGGTVGNRKRVCQFHR